MASLLTFILIGSGDRFVSVHCNTDQPPRRTTTIGLIVPQVLCISTGQVYIFATVSNLFCSDRPLFLGAWQRTEWLSIEPRPHLSSALRHFANHQHNALAALGSMGICPAVRTGSCRSLRYPPVGSIHLGQVLRLCQGRGSVGSVGSALGPTAAIRGLGLAYRYSGSCYGPSHSHHNDVETHRARQYDYGADSPQRISPDTISYTTY